MQPLNVPSLVSAGHDDSKTASEPAASCEDRAPSHQPVCHIEDNGADEDSIHSEGEDEWGPDLQYAADGVDATEADYPVDPKEDDKPRRPPMIKLWSKEGQFPTGMEGCKNYMICGTYSPLSSGTDSLDITLLYDHRREFQQNCSRQGGKRDAMRDILEAHYSKETMSFTRSFVIGGKNDCCAASMGLANGLSVATYYLSVTDCRQARGRHASRVKVHDKLVHASRTHLEAYIRDLRSAMEDDKGGASHGHSYTGKRCISERWKDYRKMRIARGLPTIGSESLFRKVWNEHTDIREYAAKAHPQRDECGEFGARLDRIGRATDRESMRARADIHDAEALHDAEHRKEREYFDDAWYQGETYPDRLTCINIDAPTQHQFDLPCQLRQSRDVVKGLDGARKWQSKVTGAMASGVGMCAYIARAAIGGGPNLVLTVLVLTMQK
eukprot:6214404-Pleurochrysis_carterae.AAC.2